METEEEGAGCAPKWGDSGCRSYVSLEMVCMIQLYRCLPKDERDQSQRSCNPFNTSSFSLATSLSSSTRSFGSPVARADWKASMAVLNAVSAAVIWAFSSLTSIVWSAGRGKAGGRGRTLYMSSGGSPDLLLLFLTCC